MATVAEKRPFTEVSLVEILCRRSHGEDLLLADVPFIETGGVVAPNLAKGLYLDGARPALASHIVMYKSQGVVLPSGEWISVFDQQSSPCTHAFRPQYIAYGLVRDLDSSVDEALRMTNVRRYLDAHYGPLKDDGWWTAFLGNEIVDKFGEK
jgi:hypothetical protein